MKEYKKTRITAAVMAAGLLLIAVGVWRGEAEIILRKAIQICMECIGLG